MIPYESASSGDKALSDLQRMLEKFGCTRFGIMHDTNKGMTIIQFTWRERNVSLEASWSGYAQILEKNRPYRSFGRGRRVSKTDHDKRNIDQAKISVCSVLRDWIKGQVTAVECGIMSFETAFMPHIMLSNGQRVIDVVTSKNLLEAP